MLENAFIIPLIPAISFVVILFFGKRFIGAGRVHVVGITALGLVWVLSAVAAFQWTQRVEDPPPGAIVQLEAHVDEHGDQRADEHGDDHANDNAALSHCLLYTSPSQRDRG